MIERAHVGASEQALVQEVQLLSTMAVTERAAATLAMIVRALRSERKPEKPRPTASSIPPVNVWIRRASSSLN